MFVRDRGKSVKPAAIRAAPTAATIAKPIQPSSGGFTQSAAISAMSVTYAVGGPAVTRSRFRFARVTATRASLHRGAATRLPCSAAGRPRHPPGQRRLLVQRRPEAEDFDGARRELPALLLIAFANDVGVAPR